MSFVFGQEIVLKWQFTSKIDAKVRLQYINMGMIKIKKGLNLPINGRPEQVIYNGQEIKQIALLGNDYIGMKPLFTVVVGDRVKLGQLLFMDKKMPLVKYTSPGCGKILSINRGLKRKFLSIVIELDGEDEITFHSYSENQLMDLNKEKIITQLLESGLWTSVRSRPFSKVADPDSTPHSIFITAMDTNPLAPSIEKILESKEIPFIYGLKIISKLTDGKIFLCKAPDAQVPTKSLKNISVHEFEGPHPAGNPGTHIHFLDPVNRIKKVWYIQAQDVVSIGILFRTGRLNVDRVISLAGFSVKKPRLITTRMGASLFDLTKQELKKDSLRIVSGSVLSGHTAEGASAFLGRYHQQVTVIPEKTKQVFLGWLSPGLNNYSMKNIVISRLFKNKSFDFTTNINGHTRAIIPIGSYEKVMPLDILPTFLFKALAVDDIDESEKLGCLELDEEDLALCTFVCPSKIDHGENLRRNLTLIDKEG